MSLVTPLLQKNDIEAAVDAGILAQAEAARLADFVRDRAAKPLIAAAPSFGGSMCSPIMILYYMGGMMAIGAAVLFTSVIIQNYGIMGLLSIALVYSALAFFAALVLQAAAFHTPAGILAVLCNVLIPVICYAIGEIYEQDLYSDYRYRALLYVVTIIAGCALLLQFSYSFMVMPIAASVFVLSVDIIPHLVRQNVNIKNLTEWESTYGDLESWVTLGFGLLTLLVAFYVDICTLGAVDFAFWLYLAGLVATSGSLWHLGILRNVQRAARGFLYENNAAELHRAHRNTVVTVLKIAAILIHLILIPIGAMIDRQTFMIIGTIGAFGGIVSLIGDWFTSTMGYVIALTITGFGLMLIAMILSKGEALTNALRNLMPESIRKVFEARRG